MEPYDIIIINVYIICIMHFMMSLDFNTINFFFYISVYVMLADFYEFEGLLIALRLKGLLDTGEYIVVGVDPKQYDSSDPQKYIEGTNII